MSKDLERSIKDRIREIAKDQRRAFNDVWKNLVLERFLARLAHSAYLDNFIFKGGMLLSKYLPLGRETVDLDFLAVNITASVDVIQEAIERVLGTAADDGFSFTDLKVIPLSHPHMKYPGFTIQAMAHLGGTRTLLSIDIGVGDVVDAAEKEISLLALKNRPLFESSVSLRVYPLEFVFAEKLETAHYRGDLNSRMKDYYDLWRMLREVNLLDKNLLKDALTKTFSRRGTELKALTLAESEEFKNLQRDWNRFCGDLNKAKDSPPAELSELIEMLNRFVESKLKIEVSSSGEGK